VDGHILRVGGFDDSNESGRHLFPERESGTDDKVSTLIPFLLFGNETITVTTENPSGDDVILFAGLQITLC
jgi:hypothetical protein